LVSKSCPPQGGLYERRRRFFHTSQPSGAAAKKEKTIKYLGSLLPGKPEAFRTVPVGLWADPVVTRKFHVASPRINNLRELSGEQGGEAAI